MTPPIDTEYAYGLVRRWASELPPVWSGSPQERLAADAIEAALHETGIETDELHLTGLVSFPGPGELSVVGLGTDERFRCSVLAQSEPAEDLVAGAVPVGSGAQSDYEGLDVTGRIVVANLDFAPPRPEKMRIAKLNGAAGVVMINWGRDGDDSLPFGTTKFVWGNPTRETADAMVTLPAVVVARPDGLAMLERLRQDPGLKLRISAQVRREWRGLILPVAWIGAGMASDREFVLAAGHYDSWGGGVSDNLSGNAALVAMARHFHGMRDRLGRDVVFAWWPGHESGIMIGSTWFADSNWRILRDRCVAHLNVANLGMAGLERWHAEAAAELRGIIRAAGAPRDTAWSHPLKTGDQSFLNLGIPSANTYGGPTEAQFAATGMHFGWWYHSENDTIDTVDPRLYARAVASITRYIEAIAIPELLPYDVLEAAEEIISRLAEIDEAVRRLGWDPDGSGYPWAAVRAEADALRAEARRFMRAVRSCADEERITHANRCIRAFSRSTVPVRYSATHRHAQDSYGQSRLSQVLPELRVLQERAELPEDDEARFLLDAEIYRALNRLSDALADAREALSSLR